MNPRILLIGSMMFISCAAASIVHAADTDKIETRLVDAPPAPPPGTPRIWPSRPPADCPFPVSDSLNKIGFTDRHVEYEGADTWYPSWAADNKMYSPYTDGHVKGLDANSIGHKATSGNATITGDDPMALKVDSPGIFASDPGRYRGRYPCGTLVHDGIWYYGTYCLGPNESTRHDGKVYDLPWLGPLVGFRWSKDFGKTWTETPCTPAKPLFGEHSLKGEPVKIGAAHFVDFGKEMLYSPDGKAYLVSHGASNSKNRRFGYNSWITGDEIYLIRVTPSIENMNEASKYEFYCGDDSSGQPIWSHDFKSIKPIASWQDNMGCVTMTYDAPLKKYIMCVTYGGDTFSYFNTYLLESDRITGPWKLVTYMHHFGEQAYFVNIPSKFISPDGHSMWMCDSANFAQDWGGTHFYARPEGGTYALCLHEMKLLAAKDLPPASELDSENNIARDAQVSASSTFDTYSPLGAIDGVVSGFPVDNSKEWASKFESNTAMFRLTWNHEETVDRVWLFDRPNDLDQVKAGMLVFSDGTTIKTGELPDDAKKGLEVKFRPKKIKWLVFIVTETKPGTPNVGLSEIAVFRNNARDN